MPTPNKPLSPDQAAKIRIYGALGGAGLGVVVLWALYISRALFNYDFLNPPHPDPRNNRMASPMLYLILAVAGTAVAAGWTWLKVRKLKTLAADGQWTNGRLTSVGIIGKHGLVPATAAYTVNGVQYSHRQDISRGPSAGDQVRVLYDPSNPARSEIVI